MDAAAALPLTLVSAGTLVRIVALYGSARTAHRLAELGLTPGTTVTVLRNQGETLLLALNDTRLALGAGLAHNIQVVPVITQGAG